MSDKKPSRSDQPKSNWFHSYQVPAEAPKPVKPTPKPAGHMPTIPMYEPMNPEKKIDWKKMVPHPKLDDIPKYEPMNPQKPMDWQKVIPHPHAPKNWFHCYQIPEEQPKS